MNTAEQPYTRLASTPENRQPEQSASLPQRYADWISYAVAVVQQAVPTSVDFTSDSEF